MIGYINENFVPVKIEDERDAPMSEKLGISQEGYPNIAVYGVGDEYVGRVIGFGGTDSWFGQLKDVHGVAERLASAKADAEADPSKWLDVAKLLSSIPDRGADALKVLDNVPEAMQKSEAFKTAKARLMAETAWPAAKEKAMALMQGVGSREEAAKRAPEVIGAIDAYLEEHDGTGAEGVAAALATKGFFLFLSDQRAEAIEVAKKLLAEHPDSPQVEQILRSLPWR